mgnify:CR=1 FL=1
MKRLFYALFVVFLLSACQPMAPPVVRVAPEPVDVATEPAVSVVEDKIANAMSGGPAMIAAEATIMEWPDVPGTEFVELRPGSNGWTCLTARSATPGNDPMCLNETFLAMVQALDASTEAPSTGIGIGYMLQEGGPVGTPPHMMIFTPRSQEDLAALSTDMDSLTWVTGWHMFPETSYAHLMLAVPQPGN